MALKVGKIFFKIRDSESVTISQNGQDLKFKILKTFLFDSTRKCMSVVVKSPEGKVIVFVKGADSSLFKMSQKGCLDKLRNDCNNMASKGLRTLVFGMRELNEPIDLDTL